MTEIRYSDAPRERLIPLLYSRLSQDWKDRVRYWLWLQGLTLSFIWTIYLAVLLISPSASNIHVALGITLISLPASFVLGVVTHFMNDI